MYRIRCAEIWGGIGSQDEDVCSGSIVVSLHSKAYGGVKGGDIYYLSVCATDRLTRVAIADVAGHGAEVADVSRWLYNILEVRMNDTGCDEVLRELNGSAVKHGIRALTTAAVIGFYATDSNPYFAYAGHAPALLRRKDSFEWQPLELDAESTHHPNAPLGVIPNTGFDQKQVALAPGDRVFLHTDGLTEVTNIARVPFGAERLKQTLTDAGGKPLPELKRSVLDAVARHVGESSEQDDVTLLALEVQ